MTPHPLVSREEWLDARQRLLDREKEMTRMRDRLAEERRSLPWVRVEKTYVFDAPDGRKTLADLFDNRSQLIIHHFMFHPEWNAGCKTCSFDADHAEGALVHLENHDVSYVHVSRAPLDKIEAYKKRMGWTARWVSSFNSDFNYDYHVSFTPEDLAAGNVFYNFRLQEGIEDVPGLSVFFKDEDGAVYHTYSSYARGNEEVLGTYMYLDITPKGRNETEIMDWIRRHDEYPALRDSA
jgi:predicted dithiol-disulfide oxidoreductase (DUF899 family)